MNTIALQENASQVAAERLKNPELFYWEDLPIEEKKRRVEIRRNNLGKYKGLVFVIDPKLRGEA